MRRSDLISFLEAEGYTEAELASIPAQEEISVIQVREVCESLATFPPWHLLPIQSQLYPVFRECSFCLSLQFGSVFADFSLDAEKNISLIRISFDGYGCCSLDSPQRMESTDANQLGAMVENKNLDSLLTSEILRRYFSLVHSKIWHDALEEYALIDPNQDVSMASP